jgi:hypothetical protein
MDSYQAIYDAVRSKISGGDVGLAIQEVARNAFDISWALDAVKQEYLNAAMEQQRPCVLFKPEVSLDGDHYMVLYGQDLMSGCAGFGKTLAEAMADFDQNWWKQQAPKSSLRARSADNG